MEYYGLYSDYEPSDMEGKLDEKTNAVYFKLNTSDKVYKLNDVFAFIVEKEKALSTAGRALMFLRFNLDKEESFKFSETLHFAEIKIDLSKRKVSQKLYARHNFEYFEWEYEDEKDLGNKLPVNIGFNQDRKNKQL